MTQGPTPFRRAAKVGDLIRCDPERYDGSKEYKEWHTIVMITSDEYHVVGPARENSVMEWDRTFDMFEFIHEPHKQLSI